MVPSYTLGLETLASILLSNIKQSANQNLIANHRQHCSALPSAGGSNACCQSETYRVRRGAATRAE